MSFAVHTALQNCRSAAQQPCLPEPVHALCSTAAVSGKVATALLVTATTPMSCCSSTALQNCRSAAQQPCLKPVHALCSTAAVSGKVATALLVTATTPMTFCSSTALQNCRSAAQQPCLGTCACPLQHCCCQWQGGNSLACHCNYTYDILQFIQPCRTAEVHAQQPCPETCAYPLQHCCSQWQGGNSLAHHCNYTYESLQFYSPAELQKCSTATSPKDLCMPSAALLIPVARWQQPCLSLQLHL